MSKQRKDGDDAKRRCDNADRAERLPFRRHDRVHRFGGDDKQRVSGRMRLMVCDVEGAHAEREIDRIDVFERRRQVRKVEREKDQRGDRDSERQRARRRQPDVSYAGRRTSPSFRLPMR